MASHGRIPQNGDVEDDEEEVFIDEEGGYVVADLTGVADGGNDEDLDEDGEEEMQEEGEGASGEPHLPAPPDMSSFNLQAHAGAVYCCAWCPGREGVFATGGGDDCAFLTQLVPGGPAGAMAGRSSALEGHVDSVAAVAFNSEGSLLATGGLDGKVLVWAVGPTLAAASGADIAAAAPVASLEGPSEAIEWLRWHPRGNVLMAGSEDATTWMWSATAVAPANPFMAVMNGHGRAVTAGNFTPDGKAAITVSADGTLRAWSPRSGECTAVVQGHGYHDGPITCLALHAESAIALTGGEDHRACLANWATGRAVGTLVGHTDSVECVAFCGSDGTIGASGSLDSTVLLWDLQTLSHRAAPCIHPAGITSLAVAPSGATFWSACVDGAARLWDARSGRCEATVTGCQEAILGLALSPDGRALLCAADDGTARIFRSPV